MRKILQLNDQWFFVPENLPLQETIPENAQSITLPHTWNAVDGHDGHYVDAPLKDWSAGDLSGKPVEHYRRAACWYYREFDAVRQPLPGGRLYIEIPAAGMQAAVYVNGKKAVYHEGGFSAFRADITDFLKEDGSKNLLAIWVSNEYKTNIYPQHADFTFYGGLYRGVNLISVPDAHFDLDYFAGPGVMVTPVPSGDFREGRCDAQFHIRSFVKNADENFTVQYSILDETGREIAYGQRPASSPDLTLPVSDVLCWSPDAPHLYEVHAGLLRRNEFYDEVVVKSGVRSFSCDPQAGFFLNGRSLPLRGVCRHQDILYKGYALTREDHYADARLIKELGANTIRLAHYQHSQDFYDACDELGFVVWAEIPFITIMNEDPAAHENCRSQMTELIVQNYNHPSICFWGLSNEVLLGGRLCDRLVENHQDLENLVKKLDPTRLTTIAHVSNTPGDCGLHGITDVEAYNHYFGWYVGKMEDNAPWLDEYHAKYPDRCLGISEYGCEGILTYHNSDPKPKDYSEEYQTLYHAELARTFAARPWVWGSFIWNMFDFGAAARNEGGVAGRNNKGLMTMDRKIRKDSYYIYKAWWNPEPMIHICGKRYAQRAGETTQIRVITNQPEAALYLNGTLVEIQAAKDRMCVFQVSLADGMNTITARAAGLQDTAMIEKTDQEPAVYRC